MDTDIYTKIKDTLKNHGITKEYTNQELDSFILEAKLLIDMPFVTNSIYEDYEPHFKGTVYYTHEYPVLTDSVEVRINNKNIQPLKVNTDGRIIFPKKYEGVIECNYTVGLSVDDINNYLIPIIACIIEDSQGVNISNVSEGDVSIGYDRTGGTSRTLDNLINNLRNKYEARVRLI